MLARMRHIVVVALAVFAAVIFTRPSSAQDSEIQGPFHAVVAIDQAMVRPSPNSGYYHFGILKRNDIIRVTAQKHGWAKVDVTGPAFEKFYGYVKYPKTEAGRIRLSADQRTATTLGPIDIFAPNLEQNGESNSSWKPVATIKPNKPLRIIGTRVGDLLIVHKVMMPPSAAGWVNMAHLRRATTDQVAAWEAAQARNRSEQARKTVGASNPDDARAAASPPEDAAETNGANTQAVEPKPTSPVVVNAEVQDEGSAPAQDPKATGVAVATGADSVNTPEVVQPVLARAQPVERRTASQIELESLEAAYAKLLKQPVEHAELTPLRELYLGFAQDNAEKQRLVEYANARAEQLRLWAQLQQRVTAMQELNKRAETTADEAEVTSLVIEMSGDYVGVGRLDASTIYDGKQLPQLFRLRDPGTGRTIAYLEPTAHFELTGMLGQLVGIVGERSYDGRLRLNLIHPQRIDSLAPQAAGK